jgi:ABC-type multidrug transport system ATPase subunit
MENDRIRRQWRREMQFLKVEGLEKSFGGFEAIHDLDFQVEEGEIIGLIGPNGSGKTSTLILRRA